MPRTSADLQKLNESLNVYDRASRRGSIPLVQTTTVLVRRAYAVMISEASEDGVVNPVEPNPASPQPYEKMPG